jgi:hypothetical protein
MFFPNSNKSSTMLERVAEAGVQRSIAEVFEFNPPYEKKVIDFGQILHTRKNVWELNGCLPLSLAGGLGLYGFFAADDLRGAIVAHVEEDHDSLALLMEDESILRLFGRDVGGTFRDASEYVAHLKRGGVRMGEIEIKAATKVLSRKIRLYRTSTSTTTIYGEDNT